MNVFESPLGPMSPSSLSITQRVFEGLSNRADDVALVDGVTGEEWTAGRLIDSVKRLAGGLTAKGLAPGRTVGLMAPNMPEYFVAFHGVVWAGGTVTPINPAYTPAEVEHQLRDAGVDLLIAAPVCLETAKTAAAAAGVAEVVVIGEGEATPLEALMGDPLAEQAAVDLDRHPAALPYSSGTTGLPKGVMLSHRNLATNVDQMLASAELTAGETAVVFLPFFHIYGLNAVLNPYLALGGRLVTMPRFDLEMFLKLNQDHKAQRMWVAPPVALALAKHPLVDAYDLSNVQCIFSAAAPLGEGVAAECAARLNCVVTQGYGMTELAPASHIMSMETARSGAVGRTIPGTQSRIVDPETGADQGVDAEGELWVKGPQVMMGYLNNPEATAETIVEDGWLRTGDLASIDADGYLYIRDRLKELIKYKGFQVAPAELEALLLTHPAVADVAVIGEPDEEAGELPSAFVVLKPGAEAGADELIGHAAKDLATYKQIRRVTFLDAIPKSASGKILRRELRDGLASA